MNKRGQFFLIAAIIMIGVIISLATVVNTVRTSAEQDSFYRRANEIGFESKRVLDYGVYAPSGDLEADLGDFLNSYADYIEQEQVLFLFGDATDMTGFLYKQTEVGSISIATGGAPNSVDIQQISGSTIADVTVDGDDISVLIEGTTYEFTLRDGQNFFFVIIKTEDEARYVAQG